MCVKSINNESLLEVDNIEECAALPRWGVSYHQFCSLSRAGGMSAGQSACLCGPVECCHLTLSNRFECKVLVSQTSPVGRAVRMNVTKTKCILMDSSQWPDLLSFVMKSLKYCDKPTIVQFNTSNYARIV